MEQWLIVFPTRKDTLMDWWLTKTPRPKQPTKHEPTRARGNLLKHPLRRHTRQKRHHLSVAYALSRGKGVTAHRWSRTSALPSRKEGKGRHPRSGNRQARGL